MKMFKTAFRCFFFLSEFFFLVLESVFENDLKKELDFITLSSKVRQLARTFAEHDFDLLTPRMAAAIKDEYKKESALNYSIPTTEALAAAIQLHADYAKESTRHSASQTVSFFEFCQALYRFLEKCNGDVLSMMDRNKQPVTCRFALLQREKMRLQLSGCATYAMAEHQRSAMAAQASILTEPAQSDIASSNNTAKKPSNAKIVPSQSAGGVSSVQQTRTYQIIGSDYAHSSSESDDDTSSSDDDAVDI